MHGPASLPGRKPNNDAVPVVPPPANIHRAFSAELKDVGNDKVGNLSHLFIFSGRRSGRHERLLCVVMMLVKLRPLTPLQ